MPFEWMELDPTVAQQAGIKLRIETLTYLTCLLVSKYRPVDFFRDLKLHFFSLTFYISLSSLTSVSFFFFFFFYQSSIALPSFCHLNGEGEKQLDMKQISCECWINPIWFSSRKLPYRNRMVWEKKKNSLLSCRCQAAAEKWKTTRGLRECLGACCYKTHS